MEAVGRPFNISISIFICDCPRLARKFRSNRHLWHALTLCIFVHMCILHCTKHIQQIVGCCWCCYEMVCFWFCCISKMLQAKASKRFALNTHIICFNNERQTKVTYDNLHRRHKREDFLGQKWVREREGADVTIEVRWEKRKEAKEVWHDG